MKHILVMLVLGLAIGLVMTGWTDTTSAVPQTIDQQALSMTQNLYCGIKAAFASPTAMFIGLAMAIFGLWQLIQGSIGGGLMLIVCGALLSSLPSLAESFLNGVNGAVTSLKSTNSQVQPLTIPSC